MGMDMQAHVLAQGAHRAGWIKVAELPFDSELRKACEVNACGRFGKNYTCPPHTGEIHALIAKAQGYEDILLFQTVGELEDSYDFEGMQEASHTHKALTQSIFDALGRGDCLMLGVGGCALCEVCAVHTNEACRQPNRALASLESYGVNVSNASALAGMKYINGENTVTFFSGLFVPKGFREAQA